MEIEFQGEWKSKRRPWTLLHMDNAKRHISKCYLAGTKELHLKRIADPFFNPDITSSDFFLFGWLKSKLISRPVVEINQLFEIIKTILITLTIKKIARVFSNWIEGLE
jgi:hypothetical protein